MLSPFRGLTLASLRLLREQAIDQVDRLQAGELVQRADMVVLADIGNARRISAQLSFDPGTLVGIDDIRDLMQVPIAFTAERGSMGYRSWGRRMLFVFVR